MKTGRAARSERSPARTRKHPQAAATALNDLVQNLGLAKTLSQYDVITSWASLVGQQIARVAKPQRMENGVLYVEVRTAPWRAELTMMRREIIERINTKLGKSVVRDIRFR